jgi:hypothetical protein
MHAHMRSDRVATDAHPIGFGALLEGYSGGSEDTAVA